MNRNTMIELYKENESLKMQIQRLNQMTNRMQNSFNDAEIDLQKMKNKASSLQKLFREIIRNCFPREYIADGLDTLTEDQSYEFIVKKLKQFEIDLFEEKRENKTLLTQLKETVEQLERFQNLGMNAPSENVGAEEGQVSLHALVADPTPTDPTENAFLAIASQVEEREYPVIRVVGEGLEGFSEIAAKLGIGNTTVKSICEELTTKGILQFNKVNPGGKGRPKHNYYLTQVGKRIYEMKFEKAAVVTQQEKLSGHGSPNHGGLMFEVGRFLEESGCEIKYDGPDTSFILNSGSKIIFDIKATDKETGKIMFLETERAQCGEGHLRDKLVKCLQFAQEGHATKEIYFVAPDKKSLQVIQQNLFKWIASTNLTVVSNKASSEDEAAMSLAKAVIVFKMSTLDDFKAGKMQTFMYGNK